MIRIGRARDALRLGLLACAIAQAPACSTRHDQFYNGVFTCDPTATREQCGTTAAGKPMTCFLGAQLGGGSNFCVEACDPAVGSSDVNHTCVSSGALLRVCHPTSEASDPSRGCPPGLQCYRTDLLVDEGVCLMMQVCAQNSDCGDSAQTLCAGTLVRAMSSLSALKSDHLQCLNAMCSSGGSSCKEGDSCLGNYYSDNPELPDICVPKCDGDGHCPPNYACAISLVAPGSPPICLPGLAGTRCVANQDCAIGQCTDTGGGLSECVVPLPCGDDFDCEPFDGPGATFVCVEGIPGAGRRCIGLTPFNGANCTDNSQCPGDQRCYRYSPYTGIDLVHGECRTPCDGGQPCTARGGIPHVCLAGGEGGCYPTNIGLPCTSSSDCAATLACLPVTPDERSIIVSPSICTITCTNDDECRAHPLARAAFCSAEGACRIAGQKGAPCDRNEQCVHGLCDVTGTGQCAL
jgi:hypothetical protein